MTTLTLTVNGRPVTHTAPAHLTLLRWLRAAGAFEVKYGCGEGVCGTCTVLLDGVSVSSCSVLAVQAEGSEVTTARGLAPDHPLRDAFAEHGAAQCGFCTPGMLLAAAELIAAVEATSRAAIREALHGNLCRCTGYAAIVDAIAAAAGLDGNGR